MHRKRLAMIVGMLLGAAAPLLIDYAIDREWPQHSTTRWLIYLAGVVVIMVVVTVAEHLVTGKREQSAERQPSEPR